MITSRLDDHVVQFMQTEYIQANEFYRHTYATIWQSGSILLGSALLVVGSLAASDRISSPITLVPIIAILFWWLGIFEPMNAYGDWRRQRAADVEARITMSGEFLSAQYAPVLATGLPRRRLRVRWGVRISMIALDSILLLLMFGVLQPRGLVSTALGPTEFTLPLSVLALALAVLVPLAIEFWKHPSLRIYLGEKAIDPTGKFAFLHVNVQNVPRLRPFSRILQREAAAQCRVAVRLVHGGAGGNDVEFPGKWSSSPEPLIPIPGGGYTFDPSKIPLLERKDIHPGEPEPFAVAVKHKGDLSCYGFFGGSYAVAGWKRLDMEIAAANCTLEVRLSTGGRTLTKTFLLHNPDGSLDQFALIVSQ